MLAHQYKCPNVEADDLIQEGWIAYLTAKRNYDPRRGVPLSAYASTYVKRAMWNYLLRFRYIINPITTKSRRKAFFNLKHYPKRTEYYSEEQLKEIAQDLNISKEDIIEKPPMFADTQNLTTFFKYPVTVDLSNLEGRDLYIITKHWLEEQTLTDIARDLNLSVERIRQINNRALGKLKSINRRNQYE